MFDLQFPVLEGYSRETQPWVATFAACLDEQLTGLRDELKGLEKVHLEWQERPGRNTIGMLLTHIAAVEVAWLQVVAQGVSWEKDGECVIRATLGVEKDGVTLPAGGKHPDCLRGLELPEYLEILDRAREKTHAVLRTWKDTDLDSNVETDDASVSRRWILYHVVRHFAAHFGQITLLAHELRDAGLLRSEPPVDQS